MVGSLTVSLPRLDRKSTLHSTLFEGRVDVVIYRLLSYVRQYFWITLEYISIDAKRSDFPNILMKRGFKQGAHDIIDL